MATTGPQPRCGAEEEPAGMAAEASARVTTRAEESVRIVFIACPAVQG